MDIEKFSYETREDLADTFPLYIADRENREYELSQQAIAVDDMLFYFRSKEIQQRGKRFNISIAGLQNIHTFVDLLLYNEIVNVYVDEYGHIIGIAYMLHEDNNNWFDVYSVETLRSSARIRLRARKILNPKGILHGTKEVFSHKAK